MKIEIVGSVYQIGDTKVISDSFRKKSVVVCAIDNGYKQYYDCEFTNDFIKNIPSNLEIDDDVTISGTLHGRMWEKNGEEKFFNSIRGFTLKMKAKQEQPVEDVTGGRSLDEALGLDEDDGLPF